MSFQYLSKKDLEVCLRNILEQHRKNCAKFNRILDRVVRYLECDFISLPLGGSCPVGFSKAKTVPVPTKQEFIREIKRIRDQIVI